MVQTSITSITSKTVDFSNFEKKDGFLGIFREAISEEHLVTLSKTEVTYTLRFLVELN